MVANVTENCVQTDLKSLQYATLQYPEKLCMPVTASVSRRHLQSAAWEDLQFLATRTVTVGSCTLVKLGGSRQISAPPSQLADPPPVF